VSDEGRAAAADALTDRAPKRFGPWRREVRSYLELFALCGLAFAQPALDVLGKNASVLVELRTSRFETVAIALIWVLGPPSALWVVEVLVGLAVPRARRFGHAILAAGVSAVLVVEVLKQQTELGVRNLLIGAAVLGLIAGVLVLRFTVVRLWLRYLAVAPVIFLVMFLLFSPVATVVFHQSSGASATSVPAKPNRVVMIVMDEFPLDSLLDGTGHIDATLFPHFAELAGDSTWYRNDTTVAPYTEQAVPAILTGDMPTDPSKLPVVTEYPRNLFTMLGDTYDMNVHESVTHLCPPKLCTNSETTNSWKNFGALTDNSWSLWRTFARPSREAADASFTAAQSDQRPEAQADGEAFVDSLQPATKPRLDFLHVIMPHWPWHYLGTGQSYGPETMHGLFFNDWSNDWTALSGRQRHLIQVQAADRLLGQVIAKLRRIGAYDKSLIVMTTDHGIAFSSGQPIRGVSQNNYPQIMWTPLFIKSPQQTTGVVDDRVVESIDILPTIADILDLKMPWRVDGRSVMGQPRANGQRPIFEWENNRITPDAGKLFSYVDGRTGFTLAMKGQASADTGDPGLRLYAIGAHEALVGQEAAPLTVAGTSGLSASIDDPGRFTSVDPHARHAPWAFISGTIDKGSTDCPERIPLAITINGRVASLSESYQIPFVEPANDCTFWADLPPQLFRAGKNAIGVSVIEPGADGEHLQRLPIRNG
jgi:Sulfatase